MVAMQATWSQPIAELVVFSNDFATRRERPRRPWATWPRQDQFEPVGHPLPAQVLEHQLAAPVLMG
ncbi:MAG: hypothetical protein WAV00_16780 [Nocardioides sp.]